jgi:hypothetical protein
MVWVRLPVYFYKRNDTFYFSRSIPSDLQHRFKKLKIEVSLRTKSESKAAKSAAALSDRLERYWDSLRMEMIYSRELGLKSCKTQKYPIAIISACRMRWCSIIASKAKAKPNFSMMYQTEVYLQTQQLKLLKPAQREYPIIILSHTCHSGVDET